MRRRSSLLLALAAGLIGGGAIAADVKPHRALYEVTLAGPSDVFAEARGLAATEIKQTCDGWRFSQRFELETTPVTGDPTKSTLLLDATESADGRRYSFRSSNDYGADGSFELVGQAEVDADGGTVRYTEPAPVNAPLPADTGFAIGSVRELIRAAAAGADQHRAHWFSGSTPDEPMLVNSFIKPAETPAGAEGLRAGKRWRLHSAFFSKTDASTPVYEGAETLTEFGVLTEAVYQYDGYGLKMSLVRLEPLPEPDC